MLKSWLAVACVALAGCSGPSATTSSLSPPSLGNESPATVKQTSKNDSGGGHAHAAHSAATLKQLGPAQTGIVLRFSPEPAYATAHASSRDKIILRDARIEAYLQKVVGHLMAHWRGKQPERIGVFVEASMAINAAATPHGDVFVTTGAIERLKSEDELAVLIGHELGHILMNHHESARQAQQFARVVDIGMQAAIVVAYAKNSSRISSGGTTTFALTNQGAFVNQSGSALAVALAAKTLSTDVALHAFSRQHEYEADLFGVEMAIHAGYDPTAMNDVVAAFRAGEAIEAARLKKAQGERQLGSLGEAFSIILSDVAKPILNTHPSADDRDAALKTALAAAGHTNRAPQKRRTDEYRAAVDTGRFARLRRLHHLVSAAIAAASEGDHVRGAKLVAEAKAFLNDASPDARLMLSAALRAQPGGADEAFRVLASASPKEKGSQDFYRVLALDYSMRGQIADANRVLERGDRDLGNPPGLLSVKLTVARQAGDRAALARHMAACEATKDESLIKVCRAAQSGVDPEAEFKAGGGLFSALSNGNKAFSGGAATPPSNPIAAAAGTVGSVFQGVGSVFGGLLKQ